MDYYAIKGGVEMLLVTEGYGNQDKVRPDGTLNLKVELTFSAGLQKNEAEW